MIVAAEYGIAEMGIRIPVVMPAKAGIQALLLDSRQEHAGMTIRDHGHFILLRCIKSRDYRQIIQ